MKSFISIIFLSILLICSACTDENKTNNGGITGCYDGVPLTVRAIATDFENPSGSGQPSTRVAVKDGHLKTEFIDGDSIGIFAVKDGAIIDNVDNTPLIFDTSSGSWSPVKDGKTLYWYDGVSYVAYYPYRENITINANALKNINEVIASLTENEKLQPAKDQSTAEKHTASDLMIATGVLDTSNSSKIILSLQFQHQFTLLVLQPQAYVGCFPPKDASFVYHKESRILGTDSATTNVALNGITAYRIDSMKYCAIVTPQQDAKITGNYTTTNGRDNKEAKINYSGSTTTFASGKCYTLKVISPVPGKGSTERGLYPGDFIFQNDKEKRIEVHPGDGLLEENGKIFDYENAIGMVITCNPDKMTDKGCSDNGWTHAYVMKLDSIGLGRWGQPGIDEKIKNVPKTTQIKEYMDGYSDTKTIIEAYGNGSNFKSIYTAFYIIQQLQEEEQDKIPQKDGLPIRSPWFLPSIGQLIDLLVNICDYDPTAYGWDNYYDGYGQITLDAYNAQLAKVDKKSNHLHESRRILTSSTEYSNNANWILIWGFLKEEGEVPWDRIGIKFFNKDAYANYLIYPFFAF